MAIEGKAALWPCGASISTIGLHHPRLCDIGQIGCYDLAYNLGLGCCVFDLDQSFDSPMQIAVHPISRRNINPRFQTGQAVTIGKTYDSRMLQKPPDDRFHSDVFGEPLHSGPQSADTTHDQADFHPGLSSGVQRINDI